MFSSKYITFFFSHDFSYLASLAVCLSCRGVYYIGLPSVQPFPRMYVSIRITSAVQFARNLYDKSLTSRTLFVNRYNPAAAAVTPTAPTTLYTSNCLLDIARLYDPPMYAAGPGKCIHMVREITCGTLQAQRLAPRAVKTIMNVGGINHKISTSPA